MNNIKVSVIVPVYNESTYIPATLNSIINQDFKDFEIIVVDDGSGDDSLKVVEKTLEKTSVPYKIITQPNQGVSAARNNGIANSNGEYIVFVDGDDIIRSDHLETLYNPDYDFSLTQLVKKDGDTLTDAFKWEVENISCDEFIKKELKMEIPFNFTELSYKRSIIVENNIEFPKDVIYGEDTYFALKALSFGENIHISNNVTYIYTQHSESAINTADFKRFEIVSAFEELGEFFKNQNRDDFRKLITTSRIPKAIFGNMNYFFYNDYSFDDTIAKMHELDLFNKLSKCDCGRNFNLKVKLFLFNPKIYYKLWKRFKNTID